MRKLAIIVLLMQAVVMMAAPPSKNPADYPIAVKVVASRYGICGTEGCQELEAVINGQLVALKGESGSGVLALGTYPAKLSKTGFVPRHMNGYDTFVVYRLLLPDGNIRDYDVVGIGTVPANP
jgi:hypothetical protein